MVDDSTPECLTLNHIPLNPDTILEVKDDKIFIDSCSLRRATGLTKKSKNGDFVSTDSVRLTGTREIRIHKEDLVITGVLEMSSTNGCVGESYSSARRWSMNCESVINSGTGFLKGKQMTGSESSSPTIEVYVAGCFSGTPIILTKTLQLSHRKKHRRGKLDSIPEYDASETHEGVAAGHDLQVAEYRNYKLENNEGYDKDYDNLYWGRTEYMDSEDGELSWFNAGSEVLGSASASALGRSWSRLAGPHLPEDRPDIQKTDFLVGNPIVLFSFQFRYRHSSVHSIL
ncbi:UNVERIFIED_CONTAM: hypothetical protein Sangu_2314800 [Sesamum angustifolium]|uniref:Uncharacterized protein n=1 Tax=Sesamum angustifolium TaxID=2727405 RepID=A0AAW2L6S8_9LAMI